MSIPWCDNWSIYDDTAYFVSGKENRLYRADFTNRKYSCITLLRDFIDTWRCNPICHCYGDKIYLFPDMGHSIQVFHTQEGSIRYIPLDRGDKERFSIHKVWEEEQYLYCVSDTTASIYLVNTECDELEDVIRINDDNESINSYETLVVDGVVYAGATNCNTLYTLDLKNRSRNRYSIDGMEDGIGTLCFDGKDFILTGKKKEIVCWNNGNVKQVLTKFPKQFGIYSDWMPSFNTRLDLETKESKYPLFSRSIVVGKTIWLFPMVSSHIIEIDIETRKLELFSMPNDEDNMDAMNDKPVDLCIKYLLEYYKDNRFIGVFSIKTMRMFEIDTINNKAYEMSFTESNYQSNTEIELHSLFRELGLSNRYQ